MKEKSLFNNGFFEFVEYEEKFNVKGEEKIVKRNIVRRPPGIRAIIIDKNNRILLSHEFRYELNEFDYRLPGGKVFDTLKDYQISLKENSIDEYVSKAVYREVREEVGIEVKNPTLYKVSHNGSMVTWDLFYFLIKDFEIIPNGQKLEENEIIDGFEWKTFEEIKKMCANGLIKEDRSIGVLLSYILGQTK